MSENGQRDRVSRVVEVAVYAPIGIGMYLKDVAPTVLGMFVARGRAEVDRRQQAVQQHVTSARSFGEVTMAFGVPMLRQRVQSHVEALRGNDTSREEPDVAPADEQAPAAEPPEPARWAPATPPVLSAIPAYDPEARADLPIPGYDALSASQVVERLAGLPPSDLDAVYAYEAAHRQRRTILGKIEQLAG